MNAAPKPVKNAVALVIRDADRRILTVKRPNDDVALGGVWGLPAAYVSPGEDLEQAAVRVGRKKLGVDIQPTRRIGADQVDRPRFVLRLTEFEARIVRGEPSVPQTDTSITQYVEMKYTAEPNLLIEAARRGSVCSRIYLEEVGVKWRALPRG